MSPLEEIQRLIAERAIAVHLAEREMKATAPGPLQDAAGLRVTAARANLANALVDYDELTSEDAALWQQVREDWFKFRWLLHQARRVDVVPAQIPRLGAGTE